MIRFNNFIKDWLFPAFLTFFDFLGCKSLLVDLSGLLSILGVSYGSLLNLAVFIHSNERLILGALSMLSIGLLWHNLHSQRDSYSFIYNLLKETLRKYKVTISILVVMSILIGLPVLTLLHQFFGTIWFIMRLLIKLSQKKSGWKVQIV